jgi:transposase, IS30 family
MGKGRRYRWLTPENRRLIEQRLAGGVLPRVVAGELGCSLRTIYQAQADAVARRAARRMDSGFRLSIEERIEIGMRIAAGESNAEIARGLGRHRSTIGREIARCGKRRGHYAPFAAERRARRLACRPKVSKLASCPRLLGEVERGLGERCSPEQISARLRREFPDDPGMRISHETIYLSLYVQGRGELRRELARCLRTGRSRRKPQGRVERRGRIPEMVMISERPAEAEDRAVPGHWEGDLLMGKASKSQVATLVERSTRFVMLAALDDRTAPNVALVLSERIQTLPGELRRSLTWDQGRELSEHKAFSVRTGVPVYFCDPHSPWQRGSNENTNGLLRQYLPKGTDLSAHTQTELDQIADELNRRPRKTLDWLTPAEKLRELLDQTPPTTSPNHP